MDPVLLARIQFALTIGFHFIFPPLTIGLAWFIFWMMSRYLRTRDDFYRRMARFWVKLFAISFVVGVATGITMEFQFGMNWSEYSRFVGDIFGAPLAAEAIFAFFLESTFLAVLVFGWNRVSTRVLWFASLLVALGSTLSAFWIIAANSWQQTPAGYIIVDGRAELTNFWEAIFNPSTLPRFFHTVDGCLVTGAFFVLGIGAWYVLRGKHVQMAKEWIRAGLIVAFVASVAQLGLGHWHAVQVAETHPEKFAAIEGVFETQTYAPALLFGIPDREGERMLWAIKSPPGLLSRLAYGSADAEVKGLKDFPKDEWPPLGLTFYPFHLMVALGLFFMAFPAVGLIFLLFGRLYEFDPFLKVAVWVIPLPFIANELGWITAEVGRQPWVVYHLLKTRDAVSVAVPAYQILLSIILFTVVYALLFYAWLYLIRRQLADGPENPSQGSKGGRP